MALGRLGNWIILPVLLFCGLPGCQSACRESWQAVRSAGPVAEHLSGEGVIRLGNRCRDRLWESLPPDNVERFMRCYVERFGEEGAESDTLWLLSNPGALIASSHAERIQAPQVAGDDHDAALGALYVDALASQWIVRRALQNPSILRRYYRATVWSGMVFGRTRQDVNTRFNYMLSDLGAHFNESSGDRFWRYARQVVLLVHATGRDDLLRNAKPGDLKRVYADWRRWMLGAANDLYGASSDAAAPYLHLSPDRLHWEYRKDVPVGGWQEGLPPLELPDRPFAEGQVPLSSQGLEAWALFQYEASSDMVRGKLQAIGRAEAQRQDKRH